MEIINLNENVLNALRFLEAQKPVEFDISNIELPFVVGSGNALNTGRILFSQKSAVFCDESTFKQTIQSYQSSIDAGLIKHAIIISASGEKDSVWEVEEAKKYGLYTTLLTCEGNSSAAKIADKVLVYKKISEPYTYNFSTYIGMILGSTRESSTDILAFLEQFQFIQHFAEYTSYSFVLPDAFGEVCPMIEIKRNELFGPHLSLRAFTMGRARHAGFVHPWEKELVITLGQKNNYFGHPDHRWNVDLLDKADYALVIALSYFIVGKIQEVKPAYFKQNIEKFCTDYGPKAYGKNQVFDVIVPGN